MYRERFFELLNLLINEEIERCDLLERILDEFECEKIYDSDDEFVSDIYLTLKHYADGEEDVDIKEWIYFLDCLKGQCEYSLEEKLRITTESTSQETT